MRIGEVAARFGLPTHVLRHWEAMGLLSPSRAEGTWRRYGDEELVRVAAILRAKDAGFGLEAIREMITARDPQARHAVLLGHRAELVRRIEQAQQSLAPIDCAPDCDHEDITTCPRFQAVLFDRINGMTVTE